MAENENEEPENPFKGTPMEQLFGAFSGGQMDMNQIMGQMQKMFAPHEGSVNFDLAKDVARHTVAAAALTALTRAEDRRRAMSAGFQVHVTKPVEPPELLAVVAGLAGRARQVPAAVSMNRPRSGGE